MNDLSKSTKKVEKSNFNKKIKLTYDKENLREIIDELIIYFDFLYQAEPKLYFSGEFDSHQSKFERASNNLEIAVISTNKKLACVLLRFVRIIIDEKPDILIFTIEDDDVPEELTVCEIFKRLFEIENLYISSFKLTDKLTVTLSGWNIDKNCREEKKIEKQITEVDIWTLPRIMKELRKIY